MMRKESNNNINSKLKLILFRNKIKRIQHDIASFHFVSKQKRKQQVSELNNCNCFSFHISATETVIEKSGVICNKSPERKAESQQIVAQRPLSCVQYLVLYLSRLQRICPSRYLNLFSASSARDFCVAAVPSQLYDLGPESLYVLMITSGKATYRRFPAWILA